MVDPHMGKTNRSTKAVGGYKIHQPERGISKMVNRKTSLKAGKAASQVLRDKRTSKPSKAAAGSALSQRAPVKRAKK